MTNKNNIKMVDGKYEKEDFDEEDSSSDIDPENINEEDDSNDAEEMESQDPPVKKVASIMNKLLTAGDDENLGILSKANVKREASADDDEDDDDKAKKEYKKSKLEKQKEKRELLDMSKVNPKANTDREKERTLRIIATQVNIEKEDHFERAKLALQTERYDDMAAAMKRVTETGLELSSEEKKFLVLAYKTIIDRRRGSWRRIFDLEKKYSSEEQRHRLAKEYRIKIEREIIKTCQEIIGLLDEIIIPQISDPEDKISSLKMKGDYYRYQAEVLSTSRQTGVIEESCRSYAEAYNIAKENMPPTHLTRLGVALNFSLFFAITLKDREKGCQLAREEYDAAVAGLDKVPRNLYERGVVQLFSAINKHQVELNTELGRAKSHHQKDKVYARKGLDNFMGLLQKEGDKITKGNKRLKLLSVKKDDDSRYESTVKEEKSKTKWNALAKDFYKEPTLNEWDKYDSDES